MGSSVWEEAHGPRPVDPTVKGVCGDWPDDNLGGTGAVHADVVQFPCLSHPWEQGTQHRTCSP